MKKRRNEERNITPLGWGGSICLGESQSRLYPHMRAKCGRNPTFVSKKGSLKFISRYGLQVVTCEVHRSSLRRLIGPAHYHFIFLALLVMSDFYPLPDPDVGLSVLVCDVEHTSFYFGLNRM